MSKPQRGWHKFLSPSQKSWTLVRPNGVQAFAKIRPDIFWTIYKKRPLWCHCNYGRTYFLILCASNLSESVIRDFFFFRPESKKCIKNSMRKLNYFTKAFVFYWLVTWIFLNKVKKLGIISENTRNVQLNFYLEMKKK